MPARWALVVTYVDESAFDALTKMLVNNVGRLPVVDRANPRKMVGYMNRASVMASWSHHLHEESWREAGWLTRLRAEGKLGAATPKILVGRVVEIGDSRLKLQVEDSVEEIALHCPSIGIRAGDFVRVDFRETDGKRVAQRVVELARRQ